MTQYKNPKPVVVGSLMVKTHKDDYGPLYPIGVKRLLPPIGGLALPGGYIDEGENAETAIAREFKEECGIETSPENWRVVKTEVNAHNQLLIFMHYFGDLHLLDDVINGFKPNEEVSDLIHLTPDTELCFPLHQKFFEKEYC